MNKDRYKLIFIKKLGTSVPAAQRATARATQSMGKARDEDPSRGILPSMMCPIARVVAGTSGLLIMSALFNSVYAAGLCAGWGGGSVELQNTAGSNGLYGGPTGSGGPCQENVAAIPGNYNVTNSYALMSATGSPIGAQFFAIQPGRADMYFINGAGSADLTFTAQTATNTFLLQGVGAGGLSSTSTDAVNGSQLFTTNSNVTALSTAVSTNTSDIASLSTGLIATNSNLASLSTTVSTNTSNIGSLSTGLSTVTSSVGSMSTSISSLSSLVTTSNTATTIGASVGGAMIGGGSGGMVQSQGGMLNNTALSTVSVGGCLATNGVDTTATGLCASAGQIAGVNGATKSVQANGATAYGAYAQAQATNTTAVGFRATATQAGSVAIGYQAQATGDPTVAIGSNAQAAGNNSVALGAGAVATADNALALGAGSVADQANTVSVGAAGSERRISNVAPGINPTDAVNVSQLNDVQQSVNSVAREAYSGIAMSMAMAGTYLPTLNPGEIATGVGMGGYKGYAAIALTVKGLASNGRLSWGGGVSTTGHNVGFNAGAGWKW